MVISLLIFIVAVIIICNIVFNAFMNAASIGTISLLFIIIWFAFLCKLIDKKNYVGVSLYVIISIAVIVFLYLM